MRITVLVLVLILVTIFIVPLVTIWAINTIFGLMIPFTFNTWLAALILVGINGTRLRLGK